MHDSQAAPSVLKQLLGKVPRLKVVFVDSGYEGLPGGLVQRQLSFQRSKGWVIERTFGWFGGYRRLIRDYERLLEMSEAVVRAALIRLMIRRLT
jgi:putative transposase